MNLGGLSYRVIFGFGSEMYVCVYLCYMNLGGLSYRVIFDFGSEIYVRLCVFVLWFVLHESRRISLNKHQNNPVGQPA